MFCNQCGKENKDGTKFCVKCGTPLQANRAATSGVERMPINNQATAAAANGNSFVNAGIKSILIIAVVLVLLLIAVVNILKVQMGVLNVSVKNELQQANRHSYICETNSCVYYLSGALYRLDKASNTITKISNKTIIPITATSNSMYGFDNNGNCYKVSDKSSDVEKVEGIKCSSLDMDSIFISGRYSYTVSADGSITKRLNSEKYNSYSTMIYKGDSDDSVAMAKIYKDYMYMILSDSTFNTDGRFIRVSLKTGKEEQLTDNLISSFSFAKNKIVCNNVSGGLFAMDLDGGNEKEYTEIESLKDVQFICANEYVYYMNYYKSYRFSVDGGEAEELGESYYGLAEINGGFASTSVDGLTLLDYDMGVIAEVEQP